MELNSNEAEVLSKAVTPLLVDNGVQPPKWLKDYMKLAGAFSYVYGPRWDAIRDRMKAE
jgi:hypothetical protein